MRQIFRATIAIFVAWLCSGCTAVLWQTDHFTAHRYPSPDPNLAVLHDTRRNDFVVCYDELSDKKGTVARRAYSLRENADVAERGHKPQFLSEVPTNFPPLTINPTELTPPYVLVTNMDFAVHTRNEIIASKLPTYRESSGVAAKMVLTPLTLALDAVAVGVIAGLMCPDCWIPALQH